MKILYALILGIVQGLTEFLPISSSGHLMLFSSIFGIEEGSVFFSVLLHFASLIAVIIVFWKDVVELLKNPFGKEMQKILIATIPTVIIALVVEFVFDESFLMLFVGFGFLISAVVIFITSMLQRKKKCLSLEISKKQALVVGVVQGLAVFPGISRSGSTICACLTQGIDREKSAKFSFLISIPIIVGGMGFEIVKGIKNGFGDVEFLPCFVGFMASFLVALFSIKIMMKLIKKGSWFGFSIYLLILAIIVLLNQFVFAWF